MDKMIRNKIGLAGEFRVMSELLLRGHNPAKSYLEEGPDIILENGLRLEVKSAHRCHSIHKATDRGKGHRERTVYNFSLVGGARTKPQSLEGCDFLLLWCINDDSFFVIPYKEIKVNALSIVSTTGNGKWIPYKNRWDLLEVP